MIITLKSTSREVSRMPEYIERSDRPARDKIREAALTLKEMADEIEEAAT